jgi:hypothetical protein
MVPVPSKGEERPLSVVLVGGVGVQTCPVSGGVSAPSGLLVEAGQLGIANALGTANHL